MKIGLVLGTSTGGIGAHVRSLAAEFVDRGMDVAVCGPATTEAQFGFASTGAWFRCLEVPGGSDPVRLLLAMRAARGALADREVVHAHGFRAAAVAAGRGGLPLVVTWHNAILGSGVRAWPALALQRRAARRADVTLCASSDLVAVARALGARDARLGPVAAPPLPSPSRTRDQVRAELGLGATDPVVLSVGRLAPQKDFDLLLDVAGRLGPGDAQVLVAGDGPLRPALGDRIAAESLPVRLLGAVDGIADLLGAADLALLTSTWEARALVAQEALRAGVPLVARSVGGIPELVGDAAVLVAGEDRSALADELAAAVRRLLGDPAERARLATVGLERASTWPTEADTASQVLHVYDALLHTPLSR